MVQVSFSNNFNYNIHVAAMMSITTPSATPSHTTTPSEVAFSPSSSPPLVLAFLAIGLFTGAMIFIFAWRRIQLNRGWRFVTAPLYNNDNHSHVDVPVDVPKLWDLKSAGSFAWGQEKRVARFNDVRWLNLMVRIEFQMPSSSN